MHTELQEVLARLVPFFNASLFGGKGPQLCPLSDVREVKDLSMRWLIENDDEEVRVVVANNDVEIVSLLSRAGVCKTKDKISSQISTTFLLNPPSPPHTETRRKPHT